MESKGYVSNWQMTQTIFKHLSDLTRSRLEFCCVSFLQLQSGNALLITNLFTDVDRLLHYPHMVELAWVIQQTYGNTFICMYSPQKQLLLRWESQQLSQGFQSK